MHWAFLILYAVVRFFRSTAFFSFITTLSPPNRASETECCSGACTPCTTPHYQMVTSSSTLHPRLHPLHPLLELHIYALWKSATTAAKVNAFSGNANEFLEKGVHFSWRGMTIAEKWINIHSCAYICKTACPLLMPGTHPGCTWVQAGCNLLPRLIYLQIRAFLFGVQVVQAPRITCVLDMEWKGS